MGLDDDANLMDDGDGGGAGVGEGGGGGEGGKAGSAVSCSICLDLVTDDGERSWAKLNCGHEFHLDCIGSAFNIKGVMQCPNCRKIEKGQWLYSNNCRPFPEISMDDLAHDEDLYDLNYSEMSFGVHWCPFGGLTRLPAFDEGEFSSTAYHELIGQHTIYAEHTAVSSASHPCPYIAYFGPIQPSTSNSTGSVSDVSNYNGHWTGPSVPSDIPMSYGFPAMVNWEHHSSPFPANSRINAADPATIPPGAQRTARASSDAPRSGSYMHPFLVGHSSASRAGSSVASPMVPPHPGSVARSRDRVQALQAYFQQSSNLPSMRTAVVSSTRRPSSHRGMAPVAPLPSSSDQNGGFYYIAPGSLGRTLQGTEAPLSAQFNAWEREHVRVDRDPQWIHYAAGGSDAGVRPSIYRQRHGSERMPSQNR